jgi:hypothetical protein
LVLDRHGSGWVALRDRFNTYWVARTDSQLGIGVWKGLEGVFSTDPVMVTCSGSNYLFGLDAGHALWNSRLVNGGLDGTWVLRGGVFQGVPAATCGGDGGVYLAARDQWNGIWLARLTHDAWTGWISGGRGFATDPRLASLGGKIALVALDGNNAPWVCTMPEGTPRTLVTCSQAGGAFDTVAAVGWNGELFMAGRSLDDGVWCWRQSKPEWIKASMEGLVAKGVDITIR